MISRHQMLRLSLGGGDRLQHILPWLASYQAGTAHMTKSLLAVAAALNTPWHQPLPATSSRQRASTSHPAAGRQAGRQAGSSSSGSRPHLMKVFSLEQHSMIMVASSIS